MNQPTGTRFDELDLEIERRIDAICRRFESDWRAGKRPPIGDYLAAAPVSQSLVVQPPGPSVPALPPGAALALLMMLGAAGVVGLSRLRRGAKVTG